MAVEDSGFTYEKLVALEEAIASGALTITYSTSAGGSKSITYRSLAEMLRVRAIIRSKLGIADTTTSLHPTFSKGLGCK